MRKPYILLLAMVCFVAMPAFAQNSSSKAAAAINSITYCANSSSSQSTNPCTQSTSQSATAGVWYNVMVTSIKASNVTDLFVSPSLVTGLYTDTTVKGNKDGSTSTAVGEGTVKVRVLLDPPNITQGAAGCQSLTSGACNGTTAAYPDSTGAGVTFDQRIQTLSANLGFIFTGPSAAGSTGCLTDISYCTPEQIQLILDTTSAHTFNYILLNVGSGMHTVVVQAEVDTSNTSTMSNTNGGVSVSNALFGMGSVTVDAVRLVNSFSF